MRTKTKKETNTNVNNNKKPTKIKYQIKECNETVLYNMVYLWLSLLLFASVCGQAPETAATPLRCLYQHFLIPNSIYIGYLSSCTRLNRRPPPEQTKHVIHQLGCTLVLRFILKPYTILGL